MQKKSQLVSNDTSGVEPSTKEVIMEEEDSSLRTSVYKDDGTAPSNVVPRDPEPEEIEDLMSHLIDDIATEHGFIMYALDYEVLDERATDGEWEWELFQEEYFKSPSWFVTNKCRQSGGSAMLAAKYFAKGILSPNNYNAIFTSYKKEEAVNKIDYVRMYLEALPPKFQKKLIRDPHHLIEFENANRTRVKIISHAQKPIRGINGDIGLDELAFFQIADEVYKSALPAVAQARGNIDIISTPFGMSGTFYDIFADTVRYPEFHRMPIMWWHCRRYLKIPTDEFLVKAMVAAPRMTIEERVFTFGNHWLQLQFKNSDLETFRQEFEGWFVDEQASFFSKDLIGSVLYGLDVAEIDEYDPTDIDFNMSIEEALSVKTPPIEKKYEGREDIHGRPVKFKIYSSIQEIELAAGNGDISFNLYGGADIGTSRHSTHFTILEEIVFAGGETLQVERFRKSAQNWELPDQERYFASILDSGLLVKLGIDSTGIGHQMGQALTTRFQGKFKAFHMGGSSKKTEDLMTNLHARMKSGGLALANDKRTIEDLYAIKRIVTAAKGVSYKADEKKRHHADAAWAISIASRLGTPANEQAPAFSTSSLTDGKAQQMLNDLGLVGYGQKSAPPVLQNFTRLGIQGINNPFK